VPLLPDEPLPLVPLPMAPLVPLLPLVALLPPLPMLLPVPLPAVPLPPPELKRWFCVDVPCPDDSPEDPPDERPEDPPAEPPVPDMPAPPAPPAEPAPPPLPCAMTGAASAADITPMMASLYILRIAYLHVQTESERASSLNSFFAASSSTLSRRFRRKQCFGGNRASCGCRTGAAMG
jgi:hypothetical protein